MGVKYSGKEKGKCSWSKCRKFKERWYYYFYLDVLVWICQRHLSEVIALSVMSLTHRGRQSRRDYIFGHSIITIRELLTLILAPNREQCFQTLPQSLLWIFHKTTMRYKQLFGVWVKKKTCCNVKVSNKRNLFCSPLSPTCFKWFIPCWATELQTVSHCDSRSVHLQLSKANGSILTTKRFFLFYCLFVFLTEFVKAAIHKSRWRSNIIWSHFQRLQ